MTEIEDQIRLGLRLVAEDVQPSPRRRAVRRRPLVIVVAVVVILVAVVLGVLDLQVGPRSGRDTPNYRPGGAGGPGAQGPTLPYSVVGPSEVAAASASDVWFVGSRVSWRWNGTAWRVITMPAVPGGVTLQAAAATADGEVWAVGMRSDPADYRAGYAFVEHWDGSSWRVLSLPKTGISGLFSVSASAPNDVWAFGETFGREARGKFPERLTRPLMLHWNGSSWNAVAVPWTRRPGRATIVATGPNDVWVADIVAAREQIEHWDGQTWGAVPAPFGPLDPVWGFSATSANDAWAVGSYRKGAHSRTLAAHWDGESWQITPTPNRGIDSDLVDVASVAPDNAWAIGRSELEVGGLLFEHWDGESWKVVPSATPNLWDGLPSLAATADGAVWVLGNCYYDTAVMRWNGSAWKLMAHPRDQQWDPGTPLRVRRFGFGHCRARGG